jgi:hypothetical protein
MRTQNPAASGVFPSLIAAFFPSSALKIERAEKHIRELNAELTAYQRTLPYEITVEHDPKTGHDSLCVVPFETVPERLMCIVGDAIHNLRTALDYAASDIEFSTAGQRTKFTKFPIDDTREKVEHAINGGFKHKAPKGVCDFILDAIQPYRGGNGQPIWELHALDILDKHKLLIAQIHLQRIRNVRCKDEAGNPFIVYELATILNSRAVVQVSTGRRNIQITDKGKATSEIFFGEGMPCERSEIVPALRHLSECVSRTLFTLGAEFQRLNPARDERFGLPWP